VSGWGLAVAGVEVEHLFFDVVMVGRGELDNRLQDREALSQVLFRASRPHVPVLWAVHLDDPGDPESREGGRVHSWRSVGLEDSFVHCLGSGDQYRAGRITRVPAAGVGDQSDRLALGAVALKDKLLAVETRADVGRVTGLQDFREFGNPPPGGVGRLPVMGIVADRLPNVEDSASGGFPRSFADGGAGRHEETQNDRDNQGLSHAHFV
jgi:hypothetical protein